MNLEFAKSTSLGSEGGAWLKRLIDASIEKDRNYFRVMKDMRMLLSGEHWKVLKKQSREQVKLVVNLAHAHVRSLVPTLFFRDPSVDCAPTMPEHVGKEKTWNSVLNNTLEKTAFKKAVKRVVLDSVLYPEGVLKDIVNKPVNYEDEEKNITTEGSDAGAAPWLSRGAPLNCRLCPDQLIVDYQVVDRDLDNARFIAIRYKRNLHELRMHPIYGKNVELKPNGVDGFATTGNAVGTTTEDYEAGWDDKFDGIHEDTREELVTIYEVWVHQLVSHDGKHKVKQQMCVLLEGQDKPIRELTDWEDRNCMGLGFKRFPVSRLVLNEIPDDIPVGELQVWKSMQIAMNWLMSRITALVENDRQITVVDSGRFKNFKKFRQQFYSGNQRVLAEVEGVDGAASIIQPTFVGRDNYTLANMLQQLLQQVSGLGQNRRGGSGIRTATEANIVETGTQLKTDEKVDTVHDFLKEVIEKKAILIKSLTAEYGTNEWILRVGGDVGSVNWVTFTSADLAWLPEIRIRVNSFRKMDSLQDMQKMMALLNAGMQVASIAGPGVRVDILYARLLESAGIHDSSKIIGDQDSEMMLQTIEIAGLMNGLPAPVLRMHNHPAHIQTIDAFIQSQYGQQLIQQEPIILERLMQHKQEHTDIMVQIQQEAQIGQMDPFSKAGMNPNAQSIANEGTAEDRLGTVGGPSAAL